MATATIAARAGLVDRLGFLGLHLQQRGDLHALPHADHRHGRVLLQRAGEDADEIELLHEGVDAGLEHLGDQRTGRIGLDFDLFAGRVRRRALTTASGGKRTDGQGVEQFRQAHARLARHADDRNQRALGHGLDDQPGEFLVGGRRALEVSLRHRLVDFDDRFQQRLADFAGSTSAPAASAGGLSVLATPRNSALGPAAR